MMLSRDHAGSGAMLARLVQIGARAGLSAEATLLHVLDGAPLPEPSAPPESVGDIVERLRTTGDVFVSPDSARAPFYIKPGALISDPADATDNHTIGGLLTIEEALQAPEKREKIANLYGSTALRNGPIAELAGSTPGSVSFFLNEFRKAGDPRIIRGDRLRGISLSGVDTPAEGPMAVDGVGAERSTERPIQSDDILPAGCNGEGGRADPVPDVSPEGADDTSDESLCFEFPEAGRPEMQDRLDALNAEAFARELGLPDLDGGKECAERDAGSSDLGGAVAAFPAPPVVQEDEPEKGFASPQQPTLDAPEAEDTADRPAGPGQDLPEADHVADAGNMVAASGDEGIDSESTLTSGESAAEEAGTIPPASASSQRPPNASAEIARLWRDTLLKQSEIAERVGKTTAFVGAIISQKRKNQLPGIVLGDQARLKAEAERLNLAPPAPSPMPPSQAPAPIVEKAPPTPAPQSAPANGDTPPDDLVLIGEGRVLVIDRGWIVGPVGVLKGFALINSVLDLLSTGELVEAEEIAKVCGVRAGSAVLKQLEHWKADLAGIGVDVVRMGGSLVSLRRAG